MSRVLTAMYGTPGETYCTTDGTPYRPDWTGVFYAETRHVTELKAQNAPKGAVAPIQATAAHLIGTIHQGAPLSLIVEA